MNLTHNEDGTIEVNGKLTIRKLGNRDVPENHNQDIEYAFTSTSGGTVEIGRPFYTDTPSDFFQTSKVRSVYVHGSDDQDKLVLPKDFPISADLSLPSDIKEGELLLATMNSIYYVSEADPSVQDCY